jgi:hypothetical protein
MLGGVASFPPVHLQSVLASFGLSVFVVIVSGLWKLLYGIFKKDDLTRDKML